MSDKIKLLKTQPANDQWVKDLKQNDYIWLVKESTVAIVNSPWEGYNDQEVGSIEIRLLNHLTIHKWYVRPNGEGFDNNPLFSQLTKALEKEPVVNESEEDQHANWMKEVSEFKGKKAKSLWNFDGEFNSYYQPIINQSNNIKAWSEILGD